MTISVMMAVEISDAPLARRSTATYCMEPANTVALIANAQSAPYPLPVSRIPNPMPSTRYPAITGSVFRKTVFKSVLFMLFFIRILPVCSSAALFQRQPQLL